MRPTAAELATHPFLRRGVPARAGPWAPVDVDPAEPSSGEWLLWPPLQAARLPPAAAAAAGAVEADPVRQWPLPYAYALWRLVAGPVEQVAAAHGATGGQLGYTPPILTMPRIGSLTAAAAAVPESPGRRTTLARQASGSDLPEEGDDMVAASLSDGVLATPIERRPLAPAAYAGRITTIDLEPLRRRLRQPPEPLVLYVLPTRAARGRCVCVSNKGLVGAPGPRRVRQGP